MTSIIRRNAFYERSHMFLPGNNVVVAFRLKNNISESELGRAVEKARIKHPLIGSHVEFDEKNNAWFVNKDTPPNKIIVIQRKDNLTWIEGVFSSYWERFNIGIGPLIKFILVKDADFSEIVAISQHSICDGLSLVYLLRDIVNFIAFPEFPVNPIDELPTIADRYHLGGIKLNPLIKKIVTKFNMLWKSKNMQIDEEDFIPIHDAFQNYQINAIFWNLDSEITRKLIEKCKKERVSVNSALYCALMIVQKLYQGDREKFRRFIMMPINIRNYLVPPVGEEVALYAGGETFKIRVNPKVSFWKQAKRFNKILKRRINPQSMFGQAKKMMIIDPSLMEARALAFLGPVLDHPSEKYMKLLEILDSDRLLKKMKNRNASGNIMIGTVLTNIGVLNIEKNYGSYAISDIYFLPPSSPLAEKILGICTFDGKLQGTIAFTEKTLNKEVANILGEKIVEFLISVV